METNSFNCRVCGLYLGYQPWGEDGKTPSYDICPCCGVVSGYEDDSKSSIQAYRKQWINNSCQWCIPSKRPSNWSSQTQLNQIPDVYK